MASLLGGRDVNVPAARGKGSKTIEEVYQKKTQLEHILLRPDTYVGSTEPQTQAMWVHDGARGLVHRTITYTPALYKIFDEILVNAADNKVRDATMDTVRVDIDAETNTIRVFNNGDGIPVEVHKEEGVYVPELIFGHLLTSSNYDDAEKKVTGGRNGYGAKLANIFSTEFVVETCDGKRQRRYRQVFRGNMSEKGEPEIKACKPTDNWTCITFHPDLAKFGMATLDEDMVALMKKRVYDLAGILGKTTKVFLNGEKLPLNTFQDYVSLYLGKPGEGAARVYEKVNDRWEVCVSVSEGQFNQVSFCNSISTSKGGTHVNYVADGIVKYLMEAIKKKHKIKTLKPFQVKNHLFLFVNAMVENPAFDSQTKECLTLKADKFGSTCELSDKFLKKVMDCGVVDSVLSWNQLKMQKELKKQDGAKRQRLLGVPKLDDANDAGGRVSEQCTLILTEGDSAKALAISGLSVVGRDKYGVFPLRGKLLNVRDATHQQIMNNAEITNLNKIMGFQHGKVYESAKSLRYGHLMIMTDQDHDGSHIKGLIMNYLHHFFPSLLKVPGFLLEFITPIVKATKGAKSLAFYTLPEYDAWKESLGHNLRGWSIKYYKGLGTSTAKEAKDYFANLDEHVKEFTWSKDEDGQAIDMAFSKKRVDERKAWLERFEPGTFLDHAAKRISLSDFVHRELVLFSRADLERSIPSVMDGFKPGQRKILYSCFKRNLKSDIKVAQLAGYVAEHSAYHHGEASLAATIVGLAQDFVGSNNVNLLVPSGQFGTRLQGGKDAASPRYIFTRLSPAARAVFPEADDPLLSYLNEEGQTIEPEWYIPTIPMVLVNGAEGIGTGWSTSVPTYNPRDVIDNVRAMLAGREPAPMDPWFRGFRGTVTREEKKKKGKGGTGDSFTITGCIRQVDDATVEITELPVRKWTQDYKEFLEGLVKPEGKDDRPAILDYKEHHTDTSVHFTVTLSPEQMAEALATGLHKKFKLSTTISTTNMTLFDRKGRIKRYDSPEEILQDFYTVRLGYYERRRMSLLASAEAEMRRLDNKVRFILAVIRGRLQVNNRRRADIEADLEAQGFDRLPKSSRAAARAEEESDEDGAVAVGASYDYLLSMPIWSLTMEKVEQLQGDANAQEREVERLRGTCAETMWGEDLDRLEEVLRALEDEAEALEKETARARAAAKGGKARGGGQGAKKRGKKARGSSDEEDEESEESSDEEFQVQARAKAAPKAQVKKAPAQTTGPTALKAQAAPKAAAAPKTTAAPKAAVQAAAPSLALALDDDAETSGSLMARLAGRVAAIQVASGATASASAGASTKAAAAAKHAAPSRATSQRGSGRAAARKPTKYVSESDDDDEADEDEISEFTDSDTDGDFEATSPLKPAQARKATGAGAKRKPAAKGAAARTKAQAPPPVSKPSSSGSPGELYSPAPETPSVAPRGKRLRLKSPAAGAVQMASLPSRVAAARALPRGAAKATILEDSDEGSEGAEGMDESPGPAPAPAQRQRRAAAAKARQYVIDDEDEEEADGASDSDASGGDTDDSNFSD